VNVWKQQKVDELRQHVAALLERRALAADIDALRRLDGEIEEVCRDLANAERQLKATP
jgi:hypothetical protein